MGQAHLCPYFLEYYQALKQAYADALVEAKYYSDCGMFCFLYFVGFYLFRNLGNNRLRS
jgi:hypothetical protein